LAVNSPAKTEVKCIKHAERTIKKVFFTMD
jgi:hypothetical protein